MMHTQFSTDWGESRAVGQGQVGARHAHPPGINENWRCSHRARKRLGTFTGRPKLGAHMGKKGGTRRPLHMPRVLPRPACSFPRVLPGPAPACLPDSVGSLPD